MHLSPSTMTLLQPNLHTRPVGALGYSDCLPAIHCCEKYEGGETTAKSRTTITTTITPTPPPSPASPEHHVLVKRVKKKYYALHGHH